MAPAVCNENGAALQLQNHAAGDREIVDQTPGLFILYSDGSFERVSHLNYPACADFDASASGVATRDVIIDASTGVWARIFLPPSATLSLKAAAPVVLYFHGGGFCIGSPASPHVHRYCARMARKSGCIWVSVYYRLAPEHPLPAAYDDGFSALQWLRAQACVGGAGAEAACCDGEAGSGDGEKVKADPWLARYADFRSCFLAGDSAGGTIVHFVAARASEEDWEPLQVKGLLLVHPAFPQQIPQSSVELSSAKVRFFHRSALPAGAPFGHPLMNPLHPESPVDLSRLRLPPVFVAAATEDPLLPGDVAYFQALCKAGHAAQFFESQGVGHCFHSRFLPGSPVAPFVEEAVDMLQGAMVEFIQHNHCTAFSAHPAPLPPAAHVGKNALGGGDEVRQAESPSSECFL